MPRKSKELLIIKSIYFCACIQSGWLFSDGVYAVFRDLGKHEDYKNKTGFLILSEALQKRVRKSNKRDLSVLKMISCILSGDMIKVRYNILSH